jgi:hypothetical protein
VPNPSAFALEFSGQGVPAALLEALAGQVLEHVRCETAPRRELSDALERATSGGTFGGARRCDVQFRAHNQTLEILVSANGGRIWQASCAIP